MKKGLPKRRSLAILFTKTDSPFKPKVIKSKKQYTRKAKHKKLGLSHAVSF